jgi:5-methylcytosine-specific restriction endonuclease McrA
MAKPYYRWPAGLRQSILQRDDHTCRVRLPGCTHHAEVIDHIIPALSGGAWFEPSNLRAACKSCNRARRQGHPPTTTRLTPPENW